MKFVTFREDTLEELKTKIDDYLAEWPWCPYHTSFDKPSQDEDGKWVSRGWRGETND
jgi:hypothetical protein